MIMHIISGVGFGISETQTEFGFNIELMDQQHGQAWRIPFENKASTALIMGIAPLLTEDQKSELRAALAPGIAIPGRDFDPKDIVGGNGIGGPQG